MFWCLEELHQKGGSEQTLSGTSADQILEAVFSAVGLDGKTEGKNQEDVAGAAAAEVEEILR